MAAPLRTKAILSWLAIYMVIATAFAGGVLAVPRVFLSFSRKMPENYRHLVRDHLTQGRTAEAERLLQRRLAQLYYDFEARFLLAETQSASGNNALAAATIAEAIQKTAAVKGRDVRASGYDKATAYALLGKYLNCAGDALSAGEIFRVALDAGANAGEIDKALGKAESTNPEQLYAVGRIALKARNEVRLKETLQLLADAHTSQSMQYRAVLSAGWKGEVANDTHSALAELLAAADQHSTPPLVQAAIVNALQSSSHLSTEPITLQPLPGSTVVDLSRFSLPQGAFVSSNTLYLKRNGAASARLDTGVFKTTSLLLRVKGTPALGMFPIVLLSSGDTVLARLYIDGTEPREYDLALWPNGAPKSLPLTISFTNDAFDSVTGDDRNVELLELTLH